eukprot:CAMPEP_0197625040 /NCGR_PEP_ID=MMETSP1338-20131121/4509_1 /TAXON_ID=43686 ORGANISM="Pelagodinium beii, Strain RCC1491" /NCGR_SAMPLE_ID=MMETSP1338 /ASSEMBLY_ACC=CAM_ASM_000754 /LENGTH=513 /DNA_ID=CAMNT_0043195341 /DNA_START=173 /DNA_END=1714 /DNA_ORIENTATION=+
MFGTSSEEDLFQRNRLLQLRLAIEHAPEDEDNDEAEDASSTSSDSEEVEEAREDLDSVRAKVESMEAETKKELAIEVRHALSGDVLTSLRLKPNDRVSRLREKVLQETDHEFVVCHRFIFQSHVLPEIGTLEDLGFEDGECIYMARAPLRCLTASHDGYAQLWQLSGQVGDEPEEPRRLRLRGVPKAARISPCGKRLLTLTSDSGGSGQIWCAETLELLCHLRGGAASANFSSDGRLIAGVDADGIGRIWLSETGETIKDMLAPGTSCKWVPDDDDDLDDEISFCTFAPGGHLVVTGSGSNGQLWDFATAAPVRTLRGHASTVRAAEVSEDGSLVVTASADATARIWSTCTGECLQVLRGHSAPLTSCSFDPNQLLVLTASRDGTVKVWSLKDLPDIYTKHSTAMPGDCMYTLEADGGVVNSACFSPDGSSLLLAGASENTKLYGAECGEFKQSLEASHRDWVRNAKFSPDGLLVATASYDGSTSIWSANTGKCLRTLRGHCQAVVSIEVMAA